MINAKIPAITSSKTTPNPFFIFLSIKFIGNGFKISKKRNDIKAIRKGSIEGKKDGDAAVPSIP